METGNYPGVQGNGAPLYSKSKEIHFQSRKKTKGKGVAASYMELRSRKKLRGGGKEITAMDERFLKKDSFNENESALEKGKAKERAYACYQINL